MTDRPPPATGSRLPWSMLPESLRTRIEARLGSYIRRAVDQPGGFSPGVAARLALADGRGIFVKAVHPSRNADAPSLHRREAQVVAALPSYAPVPTLHWVIDEGDDGWVVLAFEDVDGRHPAMPWRPEELDQVLEAMASMASTLTPSPIARTLVGDAADLFDPTDRGWRSIAAAPPEALDRWSRRHLASLVALEAGAPLAVVGDTLLHNDLRADNLLITDHGVRVVDWPHARIGKPWVDLVWFAPSVAMQGGPDPGVLLERYPPAEHADPDGLDAVIAAIAGFFTVLALRPAPSGLPTLRPFQAAQGVVARGWLAARRGWD